MAGAQLRIRSATSEDALAITDLHASAWRAGYRGLFEPNQLERAVADRRDRWTDLLSSQLNLGVFLLIAEREEKLVAFAHAGPAQEHEGDLKIYSFYAHPSYWGTGVARELMTHVLSTATGLGYQRVYLSAYRESARARKFYENLGFQETGEMTESHFPDGFVVIDVEYVKRLD